MKKPPEIPLKIGDRVEIGGRTMLSPTVSLVGVTGTIFPSMSNAPPGCLSVSVEWETNGFTEENGWDLDDLPVFVNVPSHFLTPIGEAEPEPEPKPEKPKLRLI